MKFTAYLTFASCGLAAVLAIAAPTTQPGNAPATQPVPANKLMDEMFKVVNPPGPVLTPQAERAPTDINPKDVAAIKTIAPKAMPIGLVREGTPIVDKAGRLTKTADALGYEFTFESDGKTLKDPPMIIIPNMNLELMEDAISTGSRDLRFRVTGVVTEYHGKNYLLINQVTVPPDVTQQF